MNKEFPEHEGIPVRSAESTIETNTNGDKLTVKWLKDLFGAGLSAIYVNLYDGPEQVEHFASIFEEAGIGEERFTYGRTGPAPRRLWADFKQPVWYGRQSRFGNAAARDGSDE